MPSIDAALGISYEKDPLSEHLLGLREYMPLKHRQFIKDVEAAPSIRGFILEAGGTRGRLVEAYNRCVDNVQAFRSQHLEYAGLYIHAQAQKNNSNPTEVGTGGTPFMKYLKQHRDALDRYKI